MGLPAGGRAVSVIQKACDGRSRRRVEVDESQPRLELALPGVHAEDDASTGSDVPGSAIDDDIEMNPIVRTLDNRLARADGHPVAGNINGAHFKRWVTVEHEPPGRPERLAQ